MDITVFGGGIFGLSVAFACVERGARVRLVEAKRLGAGSSGGPVGALAPHVPDAWNAKKQFQLDSLLAAPRWWARVAALSGGDPGYARTGRLQSLADDRAVALARARAVSARAIWGDGAVWEVRPARDFAPWMAATGSGLVVHDTLSARIAPAAACAALWGAIRALGGEVVTGEAGRGKMRGQVVWATGWDGLKDLSQALGRPMGGGVKGQALRLDHAAPGCPQLFVDGLHIVPHADGTTAVGSTSERDFIAPDTVDDQCGALLARARAACPSLAGARVVDRWAGVRPRANSRAPMIGPWPGRPGHFVANGGFKIGFGMAPKIGEVMADLLLEGRDAIPDGFRVEDSF